MDSDSIFVLDRPNGSGEVCFEWQTGTGGLLATYGNNSDVVVFNRRGIIVERLRVSGACMTVSWDEDGDLLGVLVAGSSTLLLWDSNGLKKSNVDLGLRDTLSCILWSRKPAVLAVGTTRGNMAIYNNNTGKRIPVLGKHSKKITCGAWSRDGVLALGSEDKNVSISNSDGDTLRMINLRAEPSQIAFSDMKIDERTNRDNTVSILVGKRTLFLYNLDDPENPVELAFQQKYGTVVKYSWFGDGYILLGFSAGYFIAISTHLKEVGQELFQVINHRDGLKDIALCTSLRMVASCGDNVVKIHEMNNLQETASVITLHQATGIDKIGWSNDGQLLAMATPDGSIHVHLTLLPIVSAVYGASAAILSSISVITVHTFAEDGTSRSVDIDTTVEPETVSLSSSHLVVGLHNRTWYYDMTPVEPLLVREREYLTNIKSIHLNGQYASVLYTSGSVQLHLIDPDSTNDRERANKIFPDGKGTDVAKITGHYLTGDLLVMSTEMGHIRYFSLADWNTATQYRHDCGIKEIYCDSSATRVIFTDSKSHIYLYNPVIDACLHVVEFAGPLKGVVWDLTDRNCFIMYDTSNAYTHIYNKDSIHGPSIVKVGTSKFPPKQVPLLLINGLLQLQTTTGKVSQLTLSSHQMPAVTASSKELVRCLKKQLALQRYSDSWRLCQTLSQPEFWKMLAESAVSHLELDWAIRGYAALKDAGTVWTLTELVDVEDRCLLSGHAAMLLGLFDVAEEWYLRSGSPSEALVMRRNLMHWDRALVLANKLAPTEIPAVSCDYGLQLELTGKYAEALVQFESALEKVEGIDLKHTCLAGVARNAIRIGDVPRGLKIAFESNNDLQFIKDCGEILENRKCFTEAASLYEKAEQWDKAAAMFIKTKNWAKVSQLFPHVTSRRIYLQFAKAKEADGQWEEAAKAYRKAGDTDNLVRIYLDKLDNSEAAVALVQETGSMEGARLVAAYFQRVSDYGSAIKFLVMSECFEEAFQLARRTSLLQLYGTLLLGTNRTEDFRSLAVHFEGERNSFLAGRYYYLAGEFGRALRHLMRVAKNNADCKEAIPLAIQLVAEAKDETLTKQLVSYLNGETDGVQKDPRYLFELYLARGMFREASRTAVVVAAEEQLNGGYRAAHELLVSTCLELRRHKVRVGQDVMAALGLLHSYILVRMHARAGDHSTAARLLTRVAASISHFPAHIVPILTSTVIECSRAGMRSAAFQHAATLMQPQYRNQVDPKYRKKIESVIRKPGKLESDDPAPTSPCPVCDDQLPDYDLYCSRCKTSLPFCIASGRHIIRDDLTACPNCNYPAILSELTKLMQSESACPLCSQPVKLEALHRIDEPDAFIEREL